MKWLKFITESLMKKNWIIITIKRSFAWKLADHQHNTLIVSVPFILLKKSNLKFYLAYLLHIIFYTLHVYIIFNILEKNHNISTSVHDF
jgi:hypothetical protein